MNGKKWIVFLATLSLGLHFLVFVYDWMNRTDLLPYGFWYTVDLGEQRIEGRIRSVTGYQVKTNILARIPKSLPLRSVAFHTRIFSGQTRRCLYYIGQPEGARLFQDGRQINRRDLGSYQPMVLKRGLNDLTLEYPTPPLNPEEFRFYLLKKDTRLSNRFPSHYYHIPGRSLGIVLFHVARGIHKVKSLGFILALGLLLGLMVQKLRHGKKKREVEKDAPRTLLFRIYEGFALGLAVLFGGYHLNLRLNLKIPLGFLWIGALMTAAGYTLWRSATKPVIRSAGYRKLLVLLLLTGFVFVNFLVIWGRILPPAPAGLQGDLRPHLQMIHHFEAEKTLYREQHRIIYPQTAHAIIGTLGAWTGIPVEKWLLGLLIGAMTGVFFHLYLIIRQLFPGPGFLLFLAALSCANIKFLFTSFFYNYYFPPLVALFFLLSSIYLFLRGNLPGSSLLASVSVMVYPFYLPLVVIVGLFLLLNRLIHRGLRIRRNLHRILLFFLPVILMAVIYGVVYLAHGHDQMKQGVDHWSHARRNPVKSLNFFNSYAILLGLSFLLYARPLPRRALMLSLGSVLGFLAYYLPYVGMGVGTGYYMAKVDYFLLLFGVIIVTFFFQQMLSGPAIRRLFPGPSAIRSGSRRSG